MNRALTKIRESAGKAAKLRHLNFLITETFEIAERQCEEALKRGQKPFTMVIKDNYAFQGVRMTCASKTLNDFIAPYTATCAQRLLDNGGCLIGKSNMDEFAMGSMTTTGCFGPVLHASYSHLESHQIPTTSDSKSDFRVAGGSSGGCAVAVATGVAEIAIGSDTGGSVRYPAALNGVFGFKPSYGRLSRHGLVPLSNSLDTPSLFTRTLDDCQRFYNILKGNDPMDSTTLTAEVDQNRRPRTVGKSIDNGPCTLVVGVPKYARENLLSPDAESVWHNAIEQMAMQGAQIRPIQLPHTEYAIHCYSVLVDMDVASNMARYDGIRYGHRTSEEGEDEGETALSFLEHIIRNRTEGFNQAVKRRILAGNFYALQENFSKYVEQAAKVQRLIQQDFVEAFQQVDCILTPVSRHSAPLLSEVLQRSREDQRLDDYFILPMNIGGVPSISIPYSKCSRGLPLGVQLVGPYLEDERLLEMAKFLKTPTNGTEESE